MSNQQILLVDGDEILRRALRLTLENISCEVLEAATVQQARAHVRDPGIGMLITEIRLPDGSGAELLLEARQADPPTETIVITTGSSLFELQDLRAMGASCVLPKPVDPCELIAAVRELLEDRPNGG